MAEKLFKQYLQAANFRQIEFGQKPKNKEYRIDLVLSGGRTYQFDDHFVNFSEKGEHLSTFSGS